MKRKIMLLTITAFLITIISCSNPSAIPTEETSAIPTEETYTVWTGSAPYSIIAEDLPLDDGYYLCNELTKSQWNELYSDFHIEMDEYRHSWTKAQIKDYLIGRGFGNSEATKGSAWLITINHGFIIDREGSMVHMIIK